MSLIQSLSASLLSATLTFCLLTASGCGTKAIGVEDCRAIEEARCRAAESCGLVDDVAACERFYRDHCLHGLMSEPGSGASVDACVKAIEAAGRCASSNPDNLLTDCGDEPVPAPGPGLSSACDVVQYPERAAECSFLTNEPPDSSTGGQPATGGAGGSEEDEEPPGGVAGQTAVGGAPVE